LPNRAGTIKFHKSNDARRTEATGREDETIRRVASRLRLKLAKSTVRTVDSASFMKLLKTHYFTSDFGVV